MHTTNTTTSELLLFVDESWLVSDLLLYPPPKKNKRSKSVVFFSFWIVANLTSDKISKSLSLSLYLLKFGVENGEQEEKNR